MEGERPTHRGVPAGRTLTLTCLTMLAFAANPLLCRMALGGHHIDPASFTAIRITAGAATLALIMLPRWRTAGRIPVNWYAVAMLFAYMTFFSFAYLTLSVGTGTLILFGAVLLTMFAVGIRAGEAFSLWAWGGLVIATLGLAYLVAPGVTAPDPFGALLMAFAGIAWGFYSLSGRVAADPLADTANNFVFAVPPAIGACLIFAGDLRATSTGVGLAIASGALASGLGYAVWYAALAGLTATRAATVQLSVPVIAAFGGVVLLSEPITPRLLIASAATLGGIAVVLAQRGHSHAGH
jgi:drug/metabolite transporter (DMT)-like permease